MNFTLYISFIFIGIALLTSLTIYWQQHIAKYLKLFPVYLLITATLAGIIGYLALHGKSNILPYNIFTTIEFAFYFFVLRQIILNQSLRKIIFIALLIYPALAVMNNFLVQKMNVFNTMTYALGCLLIVACCIYYFFEIFKLPHAITLSREPAFWICSGLLFYFSCTLPLFGLINLLSSPSRKIVENVTIITNLLDVSLYSSFSIAFLCRIKTRSTMS